VWLKGLDGAVEIFAAAVLLAISRGFMLRAVLLLTQAEIAEDPHDTVANYLRHSAAHLSLAGKHFMALYLLCHGGIKLALVGALLKRKPWAFPLAIAVFTAFIAYQLYRYRITRALGLILLSAFDSVVIALVYLEYRALKR
jgi:uncharacterized membrane protein